MPVTPKAEIVSFDAMISEALGRMKDATLAAASYQVDRSNGQWIVRRASTTGTLFAADAFAEVTKPLV